MNDYWEFDEIGYWSEVKLDIIRKYASAYSKIMASRHYPKLYHIYIDAFCGPGFHLSGRTQDVVVGSPQNALWVEPPFREYYFIDLNPGKSAFLQETIGERPDVHVYTGDCNDLLPEKVFPQVRFENYRRGLCLLDPYGLHLDWKVVATAGNMKSLDIFLNFPVMDMNRNVLWKNPVNVQESNIKRMDVFWGDSSWRDIAYCTKRNLFGFPEKEDNETIAEAYRRRLMEVAGFEYVPKPMPMRNSCGAIVYYLFFASQKPVANKIVQSIFDKHSKHGEK